MDCCLSTSCLKVQVQRAYSFKVNLTARAGGLWTCGCIDRLANWLSLTAGWRSDPCQATLCRAPSPRRPRSALAPVRLVTAWVQRSS